MNHYSVHQNKFSIREEVKKPAVVCPKPRRLGLNPTTLNDSIFMRPVRCHASQHEENCDSKAGNELLDIIRAKGVHGADPSFAQFSSSPPFFSGSPPSRVSNPLIQDSRFRDEKFTPISPRAILSPIRTGPTAPSPSSIHKGGGCTRASFGTNPTVRIEGFVCLDRDRRNRSVPALA